MKELSNVHRSIIGETIVPLMSCQVDVSGGTLSHFSGREMRRLFADLADGSGGVVGYRMVDHLGPLPKTPTICEIQFSNKASIETFILLLTGNIKKLTLHEDRRVFLECDRGKELESISEAIKVLADMDYRQREPDDIGFYGLLCGPGKSCAQISNVREKISINNKADDMKKQGKLSTIVRGATVYIDAPSEDFLIPGLPSVDYPFGRYLVLCVDMSTE